MKKIQKIILAFMLGIVPIQSAWADSKADELLRAAGSGNLEQVKTLIEQGLDIDAKGKDKMTALIKASDKGHLEVVKYLISKGANVNAVASLETRDIVIRKTALDFAIGYGYYKMIEVLKNAGAKSAREITK